MNTWTIHIENFGKIKRADIGLAPLTLFAGDNNSGKSTVMTLLYGLMNTDFFGEHYQFDDKSEDYKGCMKFIDDICEICNVSHNTPKIIEISYEEIKTFENVLNELLAANKDRLVNNLFNRKTDIGDLNITFHRNNSYRFLCELSYTVEQAEKISITGIQGEHAPITVCTCQVEKRNGSHEYRQIISFIIEYLIRESFGVHQAYFPAARTGYLMMHKLLAESTMKDKVDLNMLHKEFLTGPDIDFLEKLSAVTNKGRAADVPYIGNAVQNAVNIIEKNIIEGKILVSDMPGYGILYQPAGTDLQLPVSAASGTVAEMALLLLFLQNGAMHTVFMEEPEISLHMKLQCEIAKVLIRLVNSGIPVFATTYSDIILQHINNMIKLAGAAGRKEIGEKLGYGEYDWIDGDNVAVYQFDPDGSGMTVVSKLPCGEFGFELMTFYDVLEKMNRQTRMIEEDRF